MPYAAPFTEGMLLGASLIVAIGAQNAFVLRQGLVREHVFWICLFCAVSDALLIAAGVGGFGALVRRSPLLLEVVRWGGCLFLLWYGLGALQRARRPEALMARASGGTTLAAALLQSAAFTWANPHVYIDTVLLLGGLSAMHAGQERVMFGTGAALASFAWFFGLGYGARLLAPVFAKPLAWRILDLGIATVMLMIAARIAVAPLA